MKNYLIAAALLLASYTSISAASLDLGHSAGSTPYDRYMRPVRQVLGNLEGDSASMIRVKGLMREGRRFRYTFDNPYTAAYPAETAATRAGDCKDKALWLADQMKDENVRFVVGKVTRNAKLSHAWILWQNEGRWWILDCTRLSRPIPADSVGHNSYVPHYSWAKTGVYRHAATSTRLASVASKDRAPVASRGRR